MTRERLREIRNRAQWLMAVAEKEKWSREDEVVKLARDTVILANWS